MPMRTGQKINQEYKFLEHIYIDRSPISSKCPKDGNEMEEIIRDRYYCAYVCRKCDHIEIK